MDVYVVWETWLKPDQADKGYEVTKAIWRDMPGFKGYLGHFLLRDEDDPAHLLLISRWESREAADDSKKQYASQNLADLHPLLSRERGRHVYNLKEVNKFAVDKAQ